MRVESPESAFSAEEKKMAGKKWPPDKRWMPVSEASLEQVLRVTVTETC